MQKYSLFAGKYRSPTHRRASWNYAANGAYFVTICTQDKYPYFGEIRNGFMGLNELGCIVANEIIRTTRLRPNVNIDGWVVMPNHVHMILRILPSTVVDNLMVVHRNYIFGAVVVDMPRRGISTRYQHQIWHKILLLINRPIKHRLQWQPDSLGSIIGRFKSTCTKRIRSQYDDGFRWLNNYHPDCGAGLRIIRNDWEYQNKIKYIRNNPRRWPDKHQ